MRIFELSECPARAAVLALVATDAGYGKLGRCGPITSNSLAAKSVEVTEILSVGGRLGVRKGEIHEFRFPRLRFTRSASPLFLGGVSSNGSSSTNLTNRLHSSTENKFWKASARAVRFHVSTPLYARLSIESGLPTTRDTRGLSLLTTRGTSHCSVGSVQSSPLLSPRRQSWRLSTLSCAWTWLWVDLGRLPRCPLEYTAFYTRYSATLSHLDMNSCRLNRFQLFLDHETPYRWTM